MHQASQVRIYDTAASVVFLKTNERFGGLSNMAPGFPLRVNSVRIRTSEALYQACRFPHLPDVQRKIIDEHSPMTAKMRSKPFRNDSRPDWDTVRVKIMKWCLRIKLAHHWSSFGKLLLDTGDRPIVEQSRKDDFWGAKVTDDGSLVGMNVLGRLLMELREEIKSGIRERSTVVLPLEIPDFLLFGQSIEPVGFVPRFDSAQSQEDERKSEFRKIPAPVETAQRSLFETADNGKDAQASAYQIAAQSLAPVPQPQTIDGLRPYAEMKPSGVEWLPVLPQGWEVHRAKYSFKETDDRSEAGDEELLSVSHKTGVTPRSQKNITMFMAESYEGHKVCRPGDVVVNTMWAWMAAIGVSRYAGIVSPAYGIYRPRVSGRFEPRYLDYLLRTEAYRAEYLRSSRGITTSRLRLYPPDFLNIPFVQPPLDEQRLIVRFLDWQGAQTAKLIRAKKKIIALFNEQKQAIIHRAVTRGLDADVRLKPSGIPWLGDVPEGWDTISVGAASSLIQTGPFGSQLPASAYVSGGVPVINPSHLVNGAIQAEDQITLPEEVAVRLARHRFAVGDLAIARRGELGRCSIVTEREIGWVCGTGTIRLKARAEVIDVQFLALLLGDPILRADLKAASIGATMDNLNEGMIGRLRIPLPPLSQQFSIVSFASGLASSFALATLAVEREIALIQEFRTRLIADVVTGKIDVRAAAASLPETSEAEPIDDLTEDDDLDEAVDDAENEEVAA